MFVDGFAGGVGEGSRIGIDDGADLDGAEVFQGFGGEGVLFIKVRSDDEEAVVVESFQGLIEDLGPDGAVVPEVLMSEEGDVGGADFGEFAELVATMGDEVGGDLFVFLELLFPARVGLVDFGGADVESLKVSGAGFFGEEFGEDARFVASSAGQVEERKVFFFRQVGIEELTEISFEGFKILLEKIAERGVGHGRTVIYDSDFGI